jgi:multidrug efflux pump subunit AcrA (membrane-fusion protein)
MGVKYMRKIVKQIWDELKKKPEVRKLSTSNIAGRLLIGFFVTMVLLTLVSRTADSITVAKIDVTTGNSGYLNYLVKGTGTLVEKAEKYIDIFEGVRIVAVYTKEGELVEKGENLFQYDTKDLEDKLDDLEDDLRKAEIAMEISNLNSITETKTSGIERAELTLERAKIDLESAKEDLIEAIETVETKKIEEYELAKEAYEEAKTTRDEQLENQDKALKDAADKVTEAEEDLSELYENKVKAQSVISEYKNAINNTSVDALIIAETNIYKQYYGDEEYNQHQKDVKKAKKSLQRAEEDYSNAKEEKGIDLTDSEGAIYRRAIDDAEDEVEALTEDDVQLQNAIITYNNAVRNNNEELIEKAYQVLFELLYEEDQDKKKQMEKASDAITDSREMLEDTTKQWKRTIADEEKKVGKALESFEEAELTYLDIVSETYDYSKDVKTEEAVVESTTRAVEDAKLN